jgi:Holliday junction resolvase RusA-like endonuclease
MTGREVASDDDTGHAFRLNSDSRVFAQRRFPRGIINCVALVKLGKAVVTVTSKQTTETAKPAHDAIFSALSAICKRKPKARIVLPGLPPTVNHTYKYQRRGTYKTRAAKDWINAAAWACRKQYRKQDPLEGRFLILEALCPRRRGGWDGDNREKALLDALVAGGVILDDRFVDHVARSICTCGSLKADLTAVYIWTVNDADRQKLKISPSILALEEALQGVVT